MLQDQDNLLDPETPLIFTDGTEFYKKLAEEYISHKKGFFVFAPSGSGKTYFCKNQKEGKQNWIDADRLWRWAKAMPKGAWWEKVELIDQVDQQCDIITLQARKLGFWMMGASCNWLKPDAIVIPKWKAHVNLIKKRELNYDGGAKSDPKSLAQLKAHRKQILAWRKKGVPKFDSIEKAVNYLTASEK